MVSEHILGFGKSSVFVRKSGIGQGKVREKFSQLCGDPEKLSPLIKIIVLDKMMTKPWQSIPLP